MADPRLSTYSPKYADKTKYALPNDTTEHARLNDQGAGLAQAMHDTVIHAPLSPAQAKGTLVDIGCGTGIVTYKIADLFPSAKHVYGIDLSAVPISDKAPSNVEFVQGDVRQLIDSDERLAASSVDFVFSRLLVCGMTDWPGYVKDVFKLLRPGGYAEMHEFAYRWFNSSGGEISTNWKWLQAIRKGAKHRGLDVDCGLNLKPYMQAAGFVDIEVLEFRMPFFIDEKRPETHRIARQFTRQWAGLYWHMIARLCEPVGYSESEMRGFQEEMKRCFLEEEGKEQILYVVVGRKQYA